jgi:DNA mismatch endonuclease (patch repair protein)
MADVFTSDERSRIMRTVRSRDTKPELTVRRLIFGLGYRYRLHDVHLPGTPDLVFRSRRKIINISGCFWHMHDCGRCKIPATHSAYWMAKLQGNKRRDAGNLQELQQLGWGVMTIWECELKNRESVINRITAFLTHQSK